MIEMPTEKEVLEAEAVLRRYYESRRGDVSGWKPADGRQTTKGGVTSVFSVRFTGEELRTVQAAAERKEMPISTFVRKAALEAAEPPILD